MTSTVAGSVLEPRTIDAGGIETGYLEAGSGEPVIMLHGSGPGVSALANWQRNIPTLSQRFHVLAPDIVGFGATERPDDIVYSLRTWTDHVWAFLDAAPTSNRPRSSAIRWGGASRCRWPPTARSGSPGWC